MPDNVHDPDDDSSLVSWITGMAEDSKTRPFTVAHADKCPQSLSSDAYLKWANDAEFTAKMARQYEEGPEDANRAEFWYDVYRFLMAKAGNPID